MTRTIDLKDGESVRVRLPEGHVIVVACESDGDGERFISLGGMNCDLQGEQPCMYYPVPLTGAA